MTQALGHDKLVIVAVFGPFSIKVFSAVYNTVFCHCLSLSPLFVICRQDQGAYLQHFIFFVTYGWVQ
jgi:hypothetical protein